jgi:NTE family protein
MTSSPQFSSPQFSSTQPTHPGVNDRRDTALVLGGGGSAGNAWLIGVIAGLFDAGLDVSGADLVVGTSAGATAAVQLTSVPPPELFAAIVDAVPPLRSGPAPVRPVGNPPAGLTTIISSASDVGDMRRRLGAATLQDDAESDGSGAARWRSTVAARFARHDWPTRRILITAIDARTGEPVVFDRASGVDLVDAVAASTSNGFGVGPFPIGDDRYLDGGYRRNENADLAAGYERVLVLSPLGGRTLHPLEWGMQLDAQVDELRAGGSRVETILPDTASLDAFGDNMMNLAARPAAARAGFDQGSALAGELRAFWEA